MTPQHAAEKNGPKPSGRSTKSGWGLAFLACLLMTGIGLWWQWDAVMAWGLSGWLRQTPISNPVLSGAWIDRQQARLAELQFNLQTANGPLAVQMQGISAAYSLRPAKLQTLNVDKVRLRFAYQPPAHSHPETGAVLEIPLLQLPQVAIEALDVEIETPWGVSRFVGRLTADCQPAKPIVITLAHNSGQTLLLQLKPDFADIKLAVTQSSGSPVLDAHVERQQSGDSRISLNANVSNLLQWFGAEELMPSKWREEAATLASLRSNPGIAGMTLNLTAQSRGKLDNLQGRALLTREQGYLASAEMTFNAPKMRWTIDGHLDFAAAEFAGLLQSWRPGWLNAWRFPAGNVMGTVRLNGQPQAPLTGDIYLKAHRLELSSDSVRAEDVYLRLDVKQFAPLTLDVEMDAPRLQIGKETRLKQLLVQARLDESTLTLERATLPMMGGMLEVLPDSVDIERQPVHLTLAVRNVDLAQLLDSLNYPQLSGTGALSGKLPLRLALDSIELKDGTLKGTRPGVLRYQGPESDSENLAFSALRNLQYHNLQAKLNYQPDGHYQVGLRLEGENPQVLSGHPVAFNLNLNGHLPDLLQKGILAGDFEKPILEQVKAAGAH